MQNVCATGVARQEMWIMMVTVNNSYKATQIHDFFFFVCSVLFVCTLSMQFTPKHCKMIELSGFSVSGRKEFADWVYSVLVFLLSSPCSHLCWWQLLQVPVQPERRMLQRCVRPVSGDDWWENMTFDPFETYYYTTCLWFFLCFFLILEEAGEFLLYTCCFNGLFRRASGEGRTKKEKHRLWETLAAKKQNKKPHGNTNRDADFCLSQILEDCFWQEWHRCRLDSNQTLEKKRESYFLNGQHAAF